MGDGYLQQQRENHPKYLWGTAIRYMGQQRGHHPQSNFGERLYTATGVNLKAT